MLILDSMNSGRYSALVAAKSAAGICTPDFIRAHNRAKAVFLCAAQSHLSMVGRAGQPQGWPGSRMTGSANPARLTTNEICTSGGELTNLSSEAAIMATIPTQTQPEITIVDGHAVTTSMAVAEYFGKQHHHVVQKIEKLECSAEFLTRNFSRVQFEHRGNTYNAYQITRDGFAFLAMGFTGKKAAKFKEGYIEAFNRMECSLKRPAMTMGGDITRLQLTFRNGELIDSRPMKKGELCADFTTFVELARREGYLVIHEDDLLKQLRAGASGISKK
ncbi:Rha family transcriptional regulator [Serratia sp. PAMC26656]|uniref:Rha family phage regulatory protein n=1 Tax=Serratia sp. PAMC26656 TaxID=2775909 RepID=UPI0018F76A2A|nr:Rha family phage regulatory protein [Serratia sp. PAMC26656]MBJ7892506.1 ash family protein [Serratia sp. PAMC26656]